MAVEEGVFGDFDNFVLAMNKNEMRDRKSVV